MPSILAGQCGGATARGRSRGMRQLGTPQRVYEDPDDTFVPTFVGQPPMNLEPRGSDRDRLQPVPRPLHRKLHPGSGEGIESGDAASDVPEDRRPTMRIAPNLALA